MVGLPDVLKIPDGPEKLSSPPNNLPVASEAERAVHPKDWFFLRDSALILWGHSESMTRDRFENFQKSWPL
jgi:hypothetical protein